MLDYITDYNSNNLHTEVATSLVRRLQENLQCAKQNDKRPWHPETWVEPRFESCLTLKSNKRSRASSVRTKRNLGNRFSMADTQPRWPSGLAAWLWSNWPGFDSHSWHFLYKQHRHRTNGPMWHQDDCMTTPWEYKWPHVAPWQNTSLINCTSWIYPWPHVAP